MKSELAKARDKWLQSDDGKECCHAMGQGQYPRNRIEKAFIAGWDACQQGYQAEIDRLKEVLKNYGSCPQRLEKKP